MATKFPKDILIYISDYDKDTPIYTVATSLNEIPEDMDRETVASYHLQSTGIFAVTKQLKRR